MTTSLPRVRILTMLIMILLLWPSIAQAQTWPNEPSGVTVINDWNWNSCPGGGWQPAFGCGAIRSDPTAPLSPSSVLAMEFNPSTGAGGGDPFIALNVTEVYLGYWFKLSNPFQGETNLSNKLTFGFDGSFGHGYWTKVYGQQNGPVVLQFHLQGFNAVIDNCHIASGFGECFNRAWNMPTTVTKGVWHRVELYYKHSTNRTSRDGVARLWLDGAQQLNLTNLNTPDGVINDLYFSPTWAGPADPNRTNPDVISFDHVHVSTSGTPGGGDTTPPSQVTGLTATPGDAQVLLNWEAATDNVGVSNYIVEMQTACTGSFNVMSTPSGLTSTVTGLTNGTSYCFRVSARDASNNVGAASSTVSATPTAPVGGQPTVLGISSGSFTIAGVPVKLKCVSYYDISNYYTTDLDTLAANGINCLIGHVDDVLRNNTNSAYNSDGTIKAAKATAIEGAIDYAATKSMVIILNCLYADVDGTNSAAYLTTAAARTAAITNCVNEFKDNANVGFSLINEHNYGSFADTHSEMAAFMTTARAACAACLIWYSSSDNFGTVGVDGGHLWTPRAGTTVNTTNVQAELGQGINVLAAHDDRSTGWQNRITATYSGLRNYMNTNGYQAIPLLMEEPAREGDGGLGDANAYLSAFAAAVQAGAAGVDFHTNKGFDLSSATFISQLTSVELGVIGGLAAAVDGGSTSSIVFVQSTTGTDNASGTSATITFPASTTTGNALLLCAFWKANETISSISGHGTWGQSPAGRLARPTDGYLDCWGAPNITGASSAITVNFTGSVTSIYLRAVEYRGVHTSTMFDSDSATGTATSGTTISTSSTLDSTTSNGMAFAYAVIANVGTGTPSGLMAARFADGGIGLADLAYSAMLSNFTPSFTFSSDVNGKAGIIGGLLLAASAPPPQTTPRILTLTPTSTGATYTFTGSLASVRLQTPKGSTVYTLAQTPGGVITYAWSAGDCDGTDCWACLFARDAAGVENQNGNDYQCRDTTAVIPTPDTTPPTSSAVAPVGLVLAAGTTSQTISKVTSEAATCRWSLLDEDYDVMPFANQFTTTGTTSHSTSITGLSNGTSYTIYSRCVDPSGNKEATSSVHTFSVETPPASDTTPPSTVTNLAATVESSTQIRWTWTAATDASGISHYKVYNCLVSDCSLKTLLTTTSALQLTESGLVPSTTYRRAVTAVDNFGNESAALSNIVAATTLGPQNPQEDTIPPTRVTGCGAKAQNPLTVVVTCDPATDLVGVAGYVVEFCEGELCTNWTILASTTTPTYAHTGRANNQILNYRWKARDAAGNVSSRYSPRLVVLTSAQGWSLEEATCACRRKAIR